MAYYPRLDKVGIYANHWYYSDNPYYLGAWGMPNCTAYAYGRSQEIANRTLNYPTGNAEDWYWDNRINASQRGQEPALGSVICWHNNSPTRGGHVAVVEQILDANSIVISESGWSGVRIGPGYTPMNPSQTEMSWYFRTETVYRSNNWKCSWMDGNYWFKGFIYNEYADEGQPIRPDYHWHAKTYQIGVPGVYVHWTNIGGTDPQSWEFTAEQEGIENAYLMWEILAQNGWSLNAVCAVIGTCCYESGLNPWMWEGWNPVSSADYAKLYYPSTTHGYGLNGFTPMFMTEQYMANPVNWRYGNKGNLWPTFSPYYSDVAGTAEDGDAQTHFIDNGVRLWGQYYKRPSLFDYTYHPYIPPEDFIKSNSEDLHELTRQWVWNYGAGAYESETSIAQRASAAIYFYNVLQGYPVPDTNPDTPIKEKMPIWMMLRYF